MWQLLHFSANSYFQISHCLHSTTLAIYIKINPFLADVEAYLQVPECFQRRSTFQCIALQYIISCLQHANMYLNPFHIRSYEYTSILWVSWVRSVESIKSLQSNSVLLYFHYRQINSHHLTKKVRKCSSISAASASTRVFSIGESF